MCFFLISLFKIDHLPEHKSRGIVGNNHLGHLYEDAFILEGLQAEISIITHNCSDLTVWADCFARFSLWMFFTCLSEKINVYIWKQTWVPWFLFINTICMTVQWYIYFNTKWFTIKYIDKVLTAVLPVVILWIGQEIQLRISAWVLINWLIWPPVWKRKTFTFSYNFNWTER